MKNEHFHEHLNKSKVDLHSRLMKKKNNQKVKKIKIRINKNMK